MRRLQGELQSLKFRRAVHEGGGGEDAGAGLRPCGGRPRPGLGVGDLPGELVGLEFAAVELVPAADHRRLCRQPGGGADQDLPLLRRLLLVVYKGVPVVGFCFFVVQPPPQLDQRHSPAGAGFRSDQLLAAGHRWG